ncbi:MAG: metalloregulator ArsR/SmtB family transcription factor [Sneathiellales bacterium]|nr:metalloregulator ArsR/SmtB family transcription factor [Sneathiellales bacterium]
MTYVLRMIDANVFKALGDPTRLQIFEKLTAGAKNATALREGMGISQPAMSQHLAVLREVKLIRQEKLGRFVQYEVNPEGLIIVLEWLAKYRAYWPERISDLEELLKDMDE